MKIVLCNTMFSIKTGVLITLLLAGTYGVLHRLETKDELWTADEVGTAIGQHLDDMDWIPHEVTGGWYVVKDSQGRKLPAPTTTKD